MLGNIVVILLLAMFLVLQITSIISLHSDTKKEKKFQQKKDEEFRLFCEKLTYERKSSLVDKKGIE